jgi:acyl-CoA synthetase (AMP-forming)/AMP-acid ligase II
MNFENATTLPALLALRAAQAPAAEAVIDGALRLSNEELLHRVRIVARALWQAGVRPGDRVATLAPPSADFWITLFAATSLGAIWQGLNPKYQQSEYRYLLGDARPKVVFVRSPYEGRDYHAELAELAPPGTQLVRLDDTVLGDEHPFVVAVRAAQDPPPDEIDPEAPAVIVYTSGTTGRPKGAMLSHRAIVKTALAHVRWIGAPALDCVLCPAPINHVGALNNVCMAVFAAGGRIVFIHKVDFQLIAEATAREQPSYLVGSPTAFAMMMAIPSFDFAAFKGLYQVVVFGGAATPLPQLQALARSEALLSSVYGQTETTGMVTYTPFGSQLELIAETIGRPIEGMEIRVAAPDGAALSVGEVGEIQMRGISVMSGYFGQPEATREAFTTDGWLKTGDLGRVRADGEIAFAGRLREMFKSGGYNCYPVEIELAICEHPDVAQAAVVAVPHEVFQEVGHAFVVARPGCELRPEALSAFLRERIANYKVPKSWSIVSELATLPNGKTDKRAMRAQLDV